MCLWNTDAPPPTTSAHTCCVMVHDIWLWCHLKHKDNKICLWNTDAPPPIIASVHTCRVMVHDVRCDVTWNTKITRFVCETLMPPLPSSPLSTPVVLWYTICGFDVTWNTKITRCVCETLMPPPPLPPLIASVHTSRVMVHDMWLWCHLKHKDNKMCLWNTDAPSPHRLCPHLSCYGARCVAVMSPETQR